MPDTNTPSTRNRVFGIGLSRTGTTSLDAALWHLGLRSVHNPDPRRMLAHDFSPLDDFDAATDIAAAAVFQQLDAAFPRSRFILTVRDAESWLASTHRHIDELPPALDPGPSGDLRRAVYGHARPTTDQLLAAYRNHLHAVAAHFQHRPNDLLVMNITAGQGWPELCAFLDLTQPASPFPAANRNGDPAANRRAYPEHARDTTITRDNFNRIFGLYAA